MNRQLGELELTVMECIWHVNRSVTVREALNALTSDKQRAYTTVMTVMDHLHAKGWLSRTRDGRAYRYAATSTYAEYTATLMHEQLSGSSAPDRDVVTALVALLTPAQRQVVTAALSATSGECLWTGMSVPADSHPDPDHLDEDEPDDTTHEYADEGEDPHGACFEPHLTSDGYVDCDGRPCSCPGPVPRPPVARPSRTFLPGPGLPSPAGRAHRVPGPGPPARGAKGAPRHRPWLPRRCRRAPSACPRPPRGPPASSGRTPAPLACPPRRRLFRPPLLAGAWRLPLYGCHPGVVGLDAAWGSVGAAAAELLPHPARVLARATGRRPPAQVRVRPLEPAPLAKGPLAVMSHHLNRTQRTVQRLKTATVLAVLIALTALALTVSTPTAPLPH